MRSKHSRSTLFKHTQRELLFKRAYCMAVIGMNNGLEILIILKSNHVMASSIKNLTVRVMFEKFVKIELGTASHDYDTGATVFKI